MTGMTSTCYGCVDTILTSVELVVNFASLICDMICHANTNSTCLGKIYETTTLFVRKTKPSKIKEMLESRLYSQLEEFINGL